MKEKHFKEIAQLIDEKTALKKTHYSEVASLLDENLKVKKEMKEMMEKRAS